MSKRKRWTIEELINTSDKDFILILLNERRNACTNPYSLLYIRLTATIKRVEQDKLGEAGVEVE